MRSLRSTNGIYVEFKINDVTITKKLEENRLKEKTLILGKISHEFKNPIIVMEEVVDQIIEFNDINCNQSVMKGSSIDADEELSNMRKLNFVKNLCRYMIILVKDFEVVSSIENNNQLDVFISNIKLNDFLVEIEDIADTLISKKTQNQNSMTSKLEFKILVDEDIQEIKTDHIRLKQILINLISNSVKFVEQGSIELQVKRMKNDNILYNGINNDLLTDMYANNDNDYIRFSIVDTGEGISDELIKKINGDPDESNKHKERKELLEFHRENSSRNGLGSGYGLNIIQKLCKLLNSNLYVKKNFPCGTLCYFDIPELDLSRKEKLPNIIDIINSVEDEEHESNLSGKDIKLKFNSLDIYNNLDTDNRFNIYNKHNPDSDLKNTNTNNIIEQPKIINKETNYQEHNLLIVKDNINKDNDEYNVDNYKDNEGNKDNIENINNIVKDNLHNDIQININDYEQNKLIFDKYPSIFNEANSINQHNEHIEHNQTNNNFLNNINESPDNIINVNNTDLSGNSIKSIKKIFDIRIPSFFLNRSNVKATNEINLLQKDIFEKIEPQKIVQNEEAKANEVKDSHINSVIPILSIIPENNVNNINEEPLMQLNNQESINNLNNNSPQNSPKKIINIGLKSPNLSMRSIKSKLSSNININYLLFIIYHLIYHLI